MSTLLVQNKGEQACGKRKRRQSIQDLIGIGYVEFAFRRTCGKDEARRHIIPVCVQHAPCIGSYLDRMFSAFPCGLDPDNRIAREEFRPLGKQDIRVILISGQRDHLAEFFKIPGMAALQDRLAEAAVAPQGDLLFYQSPLLSSYIRQWTGRGIRSTAARSPDTGDFSVFLSVSPLSTFFPVILLPSSECRPYTSPVGQKERRFPLIFFIVGKCSGGKSRYPEILHRYNPIRSWSRNTAICEYLRSRPRDTETGPQTTKLRVPAQSIHTLCVNLPALIFLHISFIKRQCEEKSIDQQDQKQNCSCPA